jgi:transcriptional regulator with XRE-family HTH domain
MSLSDLATATGYSRSFLSRAERGERGLDRRSTVARIADALHVEPAELTGQPYAPRSTEDVRAQAAVVDLRDVLHGLQLGDQVEVPVRPLPELQRETWRVRQLAVASDFGGYGPLLAGLLLELHNLAAGPESPDRQAALALLMSTAHAGLWLAQGLGADDLAALLAGRAADAAGQRLADPAAAGYAQWLSWLASHRIGRLTRSRALREVRQTADQLQPHADAGPAAEMYGMLHLVQAYAAMVDGHQPHRAADHLAEAEQVAGRTGDTTTCDIWFGPTEVAAWRVSVAVEAGADDDALVSAGAVDPRRMASPSRRASHYLDVARAAVHQRRQRDRAAQMLMAAERLAPQYVRAKPSAREAVAELLVAAGGRELRGLARRVGVLS